MMIELGGGTNPHPRADVVIDLHHPKNAPVADAAVLPWVHYVEAGTQWKIDGGSVDEVYASHFMEHIPHGQPLINVMNEAWRVLKPGGTFTMIMPLVGYTDPFSGAPVKHDIGWQPWADPTHVSFWWLPEALMYFTEGPFKPAADYGIQIWGPLGSNIDAELATILIYDQQRKAVQDSDYRNITTWWAVRQGWEGVARLVKP